MCVLENCTFKYVCTIITALCTSWHRFCDGSEIHQGFLMFHEMGQVEKKKKTWDKSLRCKRDLMYLLIWVHDKQKDEGQSVKIMEEEHEQLSSQCLCECRWWGGGLASGGIGWTHFSLGLPFCISWFMPPCTPLGAQGAKEKDCTWKLLINIVRLNSLGC